MSKQQYQSLKSLREQLTNLITEQYILTLLVNYADRPSPRDFEDEFVNVRSAQNRQWLKAEIARFSGHVASLRESLRVRVSQDKLIEIYKNLKAETPPGKLSYLPLETLVAWLGFYSDNNVFPRHARVGIDIHGVSDGDAELKILEASLYEDMCALFNLARESRHWSSRKPISRPDLKRHAALCRATVSAAFYFVECYLNGLAANYLLVRGLPHSDPDRARLTEFDVTKQRQKYLSLREKIIHYTRIVSQAKHYPLNENNDTDLCLLRRCCQRLPRRYCSCFHL